MRVDVLLPIPPTRKTLRYPIQPKKKENRSFERFSLCLSCADQLAFFRALFFT